LERPDFLDALLTDPERDCVLLSAKGRSDATIAQLLELRPKTVNEYMEGAKRQYCVATSSS
jgi:DNA-binding CsgD family transcriptional regulator